MTPFYVSLIFIGIILIIIVLFLIALDKKRSIDYARILDYKKSELAEIVAEAEQMIEELNRLSDYIVNIVSNKTDELNSRIKLIDKTFEQLKASQDTVSVAAISDNNSVNANIEKKVNNEKAVNNETVIDKNAVINKMTKDSNKDINYEKTEINGLLINEKSDGVVDFDKSNDIKAREQLLSRSQVNSKAMPLSWKYKEIIQLHKNGMSETEIAKKLNIGKGEVQLVLGLRKN